MPVFSKRNVLIAAAMSAVLVTGGGVALAASAGSQPAIVAACMTSQGKLAWFEMSQPGHKCGDNLTLKTWNVAGQTGPQGDAGLQGPSGVVATKTTDLGAKASVATGGKFAANATDAGTVTLTSGTYLVSVSAKVAWISGTGVYPQFFVYNGAPLPDFSNDLFNVGSGALADGNASIDSYYGGTQTVTLTADATLHVLAFGYDADRGAGAYNLEDLKVTVTQIQAAN